VGGDEDNGQKGRISKMSLRELTQAYRVHDNQAAEAKEVYPTSEHRANVPGGHPPSSERGCGKRLCRGKFFCFRKISAERQAAQTQVEGP